MFRCNARMHSAFTCFAATANRMRKMNEERAESERRKKEGKELPETMLRCERTELTAVCEAEYRWSHLSLSPWPWPSLKRNTVCAMRWCFFIKKNIFIQNRITRTAPFEQQQRQRKTGKEFTLFKRFLENTHSTHARSTHAHQDETSRDEAQKEAQTHTRE